MERTVATKNFELWIENGIIYEVFKHNSILDLETGKRIVEERLKISNKKTMPIFVDISQLLKADSSARKYMASKEALQYISAGAFIVNNIFSQLAFNTFMKLNKPVIPTKGFVSRAKALIWLEYHKNQN